MLSAIIIVFGYWLQSHLVKKQINSQIALTETGFTLQKKSNIDQLHLSIKQTLLKIAIDKAKDCNAVFEKENNKFIVKHPLPNNQHYHFSLQREFYFDTISELVISKEIITNAFSLFSSHEGYFTEAEKQIDICILETTKN